MDDDDDALIRQRTWFCPFESEDRAPSPSHRMRHRFRAKNPIETFTWIQAESSAGGVVFLRG